MSLEFTRDTPSSGALQGASVTVSVLPARLGRLVTSVPQGSPERAVREVGEETVETPELLGPLFCLWLTQSSPGPVLGGGQGGFDSLGAFVSRPPGPWWTSDRREGRIGTTPESRPVNL